MKIRWGILGTGKIAGKFAEDFKDVQDGIITAVASRTKEKAEQFARRFAIETAYGSYAELAASDRVDAVYIAVPHTGHYECSKLCLEMGKNVLCEKPITVNSLEFEALSGLARARKLFLMEAMWMYFLPAVVKAKEWIDRGEIGEIQLIQAEFGFKAEYNPQGRLYNPELAGGALLDIGIYPIAFSLFIANSKLESLKAAAYLGETGVDEYNVVTLSFEQGLLCSLTSSIRNKLENSAVIYGTKGCIRLDDFWMSRKAVLKSDQKNETFIDSRTTTGYNFEAQEVNRILLAGKTESPVMPLAVSRELIGIMDEIRRQVGLKYPFE